MQILDIKGIQMSSNYNLRWSNTIDAGWSASKDIGLRRESEGVLEIFDGITNGVLRDLNLRNLTTSGIIVLGQYTTSTRPAYVKGSQFFDTTINKMVIGGATAWEVVTSS